MYTSKQAILAMLATEGAQDLSTLVLECRIQATDKPSEQSVRLLLADMLDAGELFTDGNEYSANQRDFINTKMIHCFDFLRQAFD